MTSWNHGRQIAVLTVLLMPGVTIAADWFNIYSGELTSVDEPIWAAADQTTESPIEPRSRNQMAAGNDYWILGNGYKAGDSKAVSPLKNKISGNWTLSDGTTLNVGSPSASRFGISEGYLRYLAGNHCILKGEIRWYGGTIENSQSYSAQRRLELDGTLLVEQLDLTSTHSLRQNSQSGKEAVRPIRVLAPISGSSPDAVISCNAALPCTMDQLLSAAPGFFEFTGDNSAYSGSFALESAYHPFMMGGVQTLGNPEVPNASALTICDNGAFAVGSNSSSATRGIRLDGDTAYLVAWESSYTGYALGYPISRGANVAGTLVKIGPGMVTLDCAYSAGTIKVVAGTLVLGANASFSDGQVVEVEDGAELVFTRPIDGVTIEGPGRVTYPEGYRINAEGVWEVRVSASADGDGAVEGGWAVRGEPFDLQAVPAEDVDFLKWGGDLFAAVGSPSRAFRPALSVVTDVPVTFVAHFGTLAQPGDITDTDGTTFVFAERQMTVTVPENVTNVRDYSGLISDGWVTNVIKKGAGTMTLATAPDYVGDFVIDVGAAIMKTAGAVGANDVGIVRIVNGAALWNDVADTQIATGKKVYFEGTGPDDQGALRSISKNNAYGIAGDYVMTGDGRWNLTSQDQYRLNLRNSTIDFAGHTLNASGFKYLSSYIVDCVLTNSDDEAAATLTIASSQKLFIQNCIFGGGPRNVIQGSNGGSFYVEGLNRGDWTMAGHETSFYLNSGTELVNGENHTNDQWCGTIDWNTISSQYGPFKINENQKDRAVTLSGPITNTTDNPFVGLSSGYLNIFSKVNTYSGRFYVRDLAGATVTPTLCLYDDAVFTCSAAYPVYVQTDFVFRMAENTSFKLPRFQQSGNGRFEIYGGPDGGKDCGRAVIAGIEKTASNMNVLYVDSAVVVTGLTSIAAGTLALPEEPRTAAQLPVFSNLVFAAGTTFDMGGNDLTVPRLTGFPTVENPGGLTISGSWTVDGADVRDGSKLDLGAGLLTFAAGAKVVIDDSGTKPGSNADFVIAEAAGIIGVPTVETTRGRAGWEAKVVGNKLVIARNRGLVIVVQ